MHSPQQIHILGRSIQWISSMDWNSIGMHNFKSIKEPHSSLNRLTSNIWEMKVSGIVQGLLARQSPKSCGLGSPKKLNISAMWKAVLSPTLCLDHIICVHCGPNYPKTWIMMAAVILAALVRMWLVGHVSCIPGTVCYHQQGKWFVLNVMYW